MNSNPQRECAEDPNIHTYGEYTRCLNSKLSNPYTIGLEMPLKQSMKTVIIVVIVIVILILIALAIKAKMNPIDLILSLFR
jgi:hypothetical protein